MTVKINYIIMIVDTNDVRGVVLQNTKRIMINNVDSYS
nr:MAG TPA: hypothetical protein [Caudoviricetes sp.]DAS59931.1 MAG TPA: hypothetical protein [Caudoviricetes sp.]